MDACKERIAANVAAPSTASSGAARKRHVERSSAGAEAPAKARRTAAATSASAAAALHGVVAAMAAARTQDAQGRLEGEELARELQKIFAETKEQMQNATL